MIELSHIDFYFDKRPVLLDISFNIEEGEKAVLLGPNGSGKSTLLKLIAGLLFPKRGKYLFNGKEISKKRLKDKKFERAFRKDVQLMFQEPDIMLFNPSVYEEISYGPLRFGMDNIKERVLKVADFWGINGLLKRPVYLLSGGEKAKVALASLLVMEPRLLLLDEPTAYLDMKSTKSLCKLLKKERFTTLVAMHDVHIARYFGERFIVLSKEHRIVFDGPFDRFKESSLFEEFGFFKEESEACLKGGPYER